jgi:hypothetical protein
MEFKEFEYLALEGGGGKGAVYKGAISALEKLMYREWIYERATRKKKDGSLLVPNLVEKDSFKSFEKNTNGEFGKRDYPSILEYYGEDNKDLKIKGISGASAGSITAFALSLGLTSEDIETILTSYPFSEEFLSDNALSEGKYRMVGINAKNDFEILTAEDDFKKLGELEIEKFEYGFTKQHQSRLEKGADVVESFLDPSLIRGEIKIAIRHYVVNFAISIILIGLKNKWDGIKNLINSVKKKIKSVQLNYVASLFDELDVFFDNRKAAGIANNLISPLKFLFKQAIKLIGNKWKLGGLIPPDKITPAISNLFWDRGIFSGFEVRDFFCNMMLFAIYKKTEFVRRLIEADYKGITEEYVNSLKIDFDDRFNADVEGNKKKIEDVIRNMTFKDYFFVTGLNLIITVTNSTTAQPVYFSHYFTPDYPVTEAVGASMSFPIAFKPLYNEADVFKCDALPAFVKPINHKSGNIKKLRFKQLDYDKGFSSVFKHVNERCGLGFCLNGNLSFRSFLPYLRAIIEKNDFSDNNEMKALCCFYYNSCFKGLLNDGGQTDNLPQRIFALNSEIVKTNDYTKVQIPDITKNVLALKLDNDYDPEIIDAVDETIRQDKGAKLLEKLSALSVDERISDSNFHFYWLKLIIQKIKVKKHSKNALKNLPKNKNIYEKISKDIFRQYERSLRGYTPWNRQKNAIGALLNSIQFGLDQGSIDNLGVNNDIVSLYCYGLGVFTFDLKTKDIRELVNFANTKSEESVFKHFKIKKDVEKKEED